MSERAIYGPGGPCRTCNGSGGISLGWDPETGPDGDECPSCHGEGYRMDAEPVRTAPGWARYSDWLRYESGRTLTPEAR